MQSWLSFALIGIFSISFANIIQRAIMRKKDSDPLASSIFFLFLMAALIGIFALVRGFVVPPITTIPMNFVISTVFYAMGTLLLFNAAKQIGASEITIISSFSAIVSILSAIIFLKESFTYKQAAGTIMVLIAIIMVQGKINFRKNKGLLFALLGSSCYALAVVNDTYVLQIYDAVSYAAVMSFLPGAFLLATHPGILKRCTRYLNLKYWQSIFWYSFFYGIQSITYYLALSSGGNASRVAPLFKSSIILTVLLAVVFLKEKKYLARKIVSALIVVAGVLLIK